VPQPPPRSPKRFASIQVCRTLAALLVVFGHLRGIELKYCTTNLMRLFDHGAIGVDLFFVISGFVISSVAAGRFHNSRNAAVFLYHRVTRIFPLLWIYTTLALLTHVILPPTHSTSILSSYSLIPAHRPMLLLQAWTLSYELYFYLVFSLLILLLPERISRFALILWAIAIIALKLAIGLPHSSINQLLISPLTLEFLAGCLLFYLYRRIQLTRTASVMLFTASILSIIAVILYSIRTHSGQADWITEAPWPRPILYGIPAALFLYATIELERTATLRFHSLFETIGDWTYSIYLSHVFVLELIGLLTHHLFPTLQYRILLIDLISLPAAVAIGYLSFTYIENPLKTRLYQLAPRNR
jgi:exopolysaccharide production protein ExoZ